MPSSRQTLDDQHLTDLALGNNESTVWPLQIKFTVAANSNLYGCAACPRGINGLKVSAYAVLFVLAGLPSTGEAAMPGVVASINPVHSLVAGVLGETGEPKLLVSTSASPHMFQMRPSDATTLRGADLIVWVGENMETFLNRPIKNLGAEADVVTLHEVAGIQLLPNREGGVWREEEPEVHEDDDDLNHDHGEFDLHFWLDPGNARQIVDVVADALIRLDPDQAPTYRHNAEVMRARIDALEASLRERLAPVRQQRFIVFHDAFQYFEQAFGLTSVGAVSIDPARPPGAKRLAELRGALAAHEVQCIFAEPQFKPDLIRTVVEGTSIRSAELDPLGADIEPGADAWFEIMRGIGKSITDCLGGT